VPISNRAREGVKKSYRKGNAGDSSWRLIGIEEEQDRNQQETSGRADKRAESSDKQTDEC
jgi:hypothetical protein